MRKNHEMLLHFVGIGGIGMSGIAEMFLNQGYRISGSDMADTDITRRLKDLGAVISIGHKAENVAGATVVVISSAVRPTNPEVVEARRQRIPIIPRAEMLGELMRGKTGIAVAGTHGKTTTTSMLATVLTTAGMDPTSVIGGKVDSLGGNAKLGQGKYVVAEADESDGSFLQLPAMYGVITNIDNDHLDHYGSLPAIEDAFVKFVNKLPFYGVAAICGDDPGVRRCLGKFTKPVITYGTSEDCDYIAMDVKPKGLGSTFTVVRRETDSIGTLFLKKLGQITLNVPGAHNVLNALGTVVISLSLDIPFDKVASGLAAYAGVRRRFDIRWRDEATNRLIVDDYGHHPTEIAVTLAAARAYWSGKIVTVFQPHRYSRTLHCRFGFFTAFRDTDTLLLTDIYSAGEDPIEGISGESLAGDIKKFALPAQEIVFVGGVDEAKRHVLEKFERDVMVLCLGAGSITKLPDHLIEAVASSAKTMTSIAKGVFVAADSAMQAAKK
jgi:UDP-N-acetylmuramate--alanine ligase